MEQLGRISAKQVNSGQSQLSLSIISTLESNIAQEVVLNDAGNKRSFITCCALHTRTRNCLSGEKSEK